MKKEMAKGANAASTGQTGERAPGRKLLPLLVCFLLGLGAGAYWYYRAARPSGAPGSDPAAGQPSGAMSETLKSDLQQLDSPVEIRFYVPAHPKILPEPVRAFADRVTELLSDYKQEADGKIHITRLDPLSNPEAEASAKADGIKPLTLATGDFYYFGLALAHHGRKEMVSPLLLEWEAALPSDLSRALLRLTASRPGAAPTTEPNLATAKETLQEVLRAIPEIASVSLADGTQILRSASLEQLKAAVGEMQTQLAAAQQKLATARAGTSEAEQQAALAEVEQLQARQTETIQQITQRLHDQIAAFKQLKEAKP